MNLGYFKTAQIQNVKGPHFKGLVLISLFNVYNAFVLTTI